MATNQKYTSPLDRLDKIVASEKLSSSKLEDIFTELDADQIREWIDALETFVDSYIQANDDFLDWQNAEGREEKSDARERLLESLETANNNTMLFTELPEIPELGLTPVDEPTGEEE